MNLLKYVIIVMGVCMTFCLAEEPEMGRADLREAGDRISAALFGNLGETLQKQIAQNGVEAAIPFCKAVAIPLTVATAGSEEHVQSVRRIGVRTRNPANLPDVTDRAVLEEFLHDWSREAPPPAGILREVNTDSGKTELRYYRPIQMAVTCLACHGSTDQIQFSVLKTIRGIYPEDKAIDFKEGDLRGAIVVTFEKPAP